MGSTNEGKRVRDLEEEMLSPEAKRLRENILDDLDSDTEELTEAAEELDRFVKSFEKEITAVEIVDLTSESGESASDLCYLLEATDDELGLPPTADSSPIGVGRSHGCDPVAVDSALAVIAGEVFDEDSFGYGFGYGYGYGFGATVDSEEFEYVALDGLFDYSDGGFGSVDGFVDPRFCRPGRI